MTPDQSQLATEKRHAAAAALRWVRDGMLLSLGSGSTSAAFITLLGEAMQAGQLRVQGTATSLASEALARQMGIPLVEPRRGLRFDLAVDGADELDSHLRLIKGGGGALLREKLLETASEYFLVIADSTKLVPQLGRFPLPLEVVPFALPWVMDTVEKLGGAPVVRTDKADPNQLYRSDQNNLLVDCHFNVISDPERLMAQLQNTPGIVEQGLFLGLAKAALIANGEEVQVIRPGQAPALASDFVNLP